MGVLPAAFAGIPLMHNIGILIVGILYFAAGGMLGSALFEWWHGRITEFMREPGPFWFTIVANLLGLPCLYLLWRKRNTVMPIQSGNSRLRFFALALHGLPVNQRIAFLLGSVLWVIGFVVALVFSL
jgi:hypothetical protein